MLHYNTTEARKNFSDLVSRVKYQKIIISIGKRDEGEVLLIPKPELNQDLPISQINAASSSFDFLGDEPELYSLTDLKKRYV